jgi:hypothetical protein
VLFFASCQSDAKKEDANGNTPSTVVDKMYQAVKAKDFATAVAYNKIPDNVKIVNSNLYEQFVGYPANEDGKVIVPGDEWKSFLIDKMQSQSENYALLDWEIVSEEISKTDPNSAKVKTKIHIMNGGSESKVDCSFPLKRENGIWLIIG